MKQNIKYLLNIVTVFTVALFFSCTDNYKEVQKIGISENEPIGEAENINLKVTDSGKVTRHLVGARMLNFSNRDFPYYEFPEGATLHIYDGNKKSTIVSDYAVVYDATSIIDLQGNVVITTHDNRVLKSEQLYFDRKKEWIFTNVPVTFESEQDVIHGNGFDSNGDFSNAEVLEVTGIFAVED
ncbi:LPS export ABC transporter periplasmic protein LptC [Seonamhaeicola algicola]|uniref:LPS export ABC transporter periplasmic protein LptC n=1 Tax=Seonamhaeicola algicola TaxID=1719036 RepID=A0A5C7AH94_9FLAO|nr:LPS export ABC transporter periplasmic protein LptC [Seonamhaeicola algicola]TXE07279.1 LPS export ABC transporter periplasmic protein LptC [Seonamhaeicola algicola]